MLMQLVLLQQIAVDTLTSRKKSLETDACLSRALLNEEYASNAELVIAGKEVMASLQEREKKLTTLEEEKVKLACKLLAVSDEVSAKEEYYEDLLMKWKEGVDKTVEEAARWRLTREMEK